MAAINVLEVKVLDNPARFLDPFRFEVTFECVAALEEGRSFFNWS